MSIDWPSFLLGMGVALHVCGLLYWLTVSGIRRADVAWRNEQRRRLDDLVERHERQYAETRREMGLPPRRVS